MSNFTSNPIKERRAPFSEAEKAYIFEQMSTAKQRSLDSNTVAKHLADELDSSFYTIKNVYGKVLRKKKQEEKERQMELTLNEVEEKDIVKVEAPEVSPVEKVVEQVKTEPLKTEVKATTEPSGTEKIIAFQTKAFLKELEEVIRERDSWEAKYHELKEEHENMKDKFLKKLLAD